MTRPLRTVQRLALVATVIGLVPPLTGRAQDSHAVVQATDLRGPFSETAVVNAPFTADATLTVVEATKSGPRTWTTTRHIYRDATGRARVDYEAPLPNGKTRMVAVILQEPQPRPGHARAYTVDADTRTIRRESRGLMNLQFSGWAQFDIAVGLSDFRNFAIDMGATADVEPIGERRIEGLAAVGWRLTGSADSSQPDERWESPELHMVLRASFVDGRTHAAIDYRLTNIRRVEPDARLFEMPTDYTMVTEMFFRTGRGKPLD